MVGQSGPIDVHAHLSPPARIAALGARQIHIPAAVDWTPARHLEDMAAAGVATSLVSVTVPGLWFGEAPGAQRLARACNDYAASLADGHRGRIGMFTALPLPDIDGSLAEIAYGLDTLKADGVELFTSYGDKWLGDPAFDPVMAELNRRKAVVHAHPTTAACCRNLLAGVPDTVIEFGTDTTRAIAQLVFSGAAARFPDIQLIFSHAGGTMPFLIERFDVLARMPPNAARFPTGVREQLRRFHYDTAQAANPIAMSGLKQLVPVSNILFGSDYPFRTAREHVDGLAGCGVFDAAEIAAIERGNALRLFPRHASPA